MGIDNLGESIRSERIRQGLTQEQLAEKADISLNFMSLIENGKNMSVQTLINISSALGLSIDKLVYSEENYDPDIISDQILYNLSSLTDDEKLFFLNMIKQYKTLNK